MSKSSSLFNYVAAAVAAYFGQYQLAASFLSAGVGAEKARRARNRARDAYNAGLQDRMVMLDLQPSAPRTLVLGRVRAVEGIRRRWVSGTNSEQLTAVVSFAGHEIDAFETFWANDIELTLDVDGWVQTEPYLKTSTRTDQLGGTLDGAGGASVTLTSTPISGSVTAVSSSGVGDSLSQIELAVSGSGTSYTLSGGDAGAGYQVTWQTSAGQSLMRIRPYLGASGQDVGGDLAAEYPGKLTTSDRFEGMALAVVDMFFDPDVYPQGWPNITATMRGAKCLDPRDASTAWTENPALHAYHYARWANGWAVPVDEIRTADIEAAADVCDTSTVFTLGVDDVTLPRYRCGIVISSDADPRAAMGDIMQTMAGRWGWAGGTWRMRAGTMAAATFALDEGWPAQRVEAGGRVSNAPVVRIVNGVPRDEQVNSISGNCVDPDQRYQALPYPTVRDSVLVAAKGEQAFEVDLAGVNHIAHAQHLASITIREGQAPLRMEVQSNLNAYRCELFDVGTVTLDRYGMAAKTMEVVGWRWRPAEGVTLKLAEITAAMYDTIDELTGRDPAPNGDLPQPWDVEQITGLAVTSGTTELTDTSVITRTRATWTAAVSQAVRVGGHVEVQYTQAAEDLPAGDWPSWMEPGDATSATIAGLMTGRYYLFRARAINAMGVRGPWSAQVLHKVALPPVAAGTLNLTTDRFPYFGFADGTTHTAQAPGDGLLTITAALVGLTGTPTFTATARNSGGGSLGAVTLGGSGLVRTMTAAQFVAPGTSGSVRTVEVTATLAGVSDTLIIYRQDSTTTAPRLYLSNPTHTVATDGNGEGGDYTGAETDVQVYTGTTDATSAWSFAISADTGVTATINGGAGPVTGTASVTVAVSDMTVPDGAVLITATKSGETDLTATFAVTKNEATGTYQVYWDPRAEVVLPVGADGVVSSYADAYSSLVIEAPGGVSDVANWAYSKADTNVTSTLTSNLVQITGVPSLGTLGTVTYTDISSALPSGWTRPAKVIWTGSRWVALGFHASVDYSKVQTSSDYATWTTVDVGSSARWSDGAAGNGVVIAVAMSAITNALVRSSDHGATWTADTHGTTMQVGFVAFLGSHFALAQVGGTGGRISTDGDTWSAITLPGSSCRLWGTTGRWLAETSSATYHYSTNAGTSWAASTGLPAVSSYGAAMYRGRFVLLPNTGSGTATFYYSDNGGASFAAGTLPQSVNGVGFFGVVSGVLYVIGNDGKLQYTTDGVRWRYSSVSTTSSMAGGAIDGMNSVDMPIAYLPGVTTTSPYRYYTHPLLATSEDEGFVTVTATKPGESDIVRALPVRRATPTAGGHAFFAIPYGLVMPATSDGVVTDFSAATITAYAQLNGIDDTAAWSWTWTATNLTPTSGSTNVATFTAMSSAQDTGTVTFTATRAGYQNVTGTLLVRKAKGAEGSGPRIGAAFSVVDVLNTFVGVRFNSDGSVDVKRGSGGSYTRFTQWAGAVVAGVGNSYWLRADLRAGGHALSAGTTGSWLALSSARSYELSDAASGTHLSEIDVAIGTSSAGANAVVGFFSLKLIVP